MKRILVVAVAAILAWGGFTFFSNHAGAEAHAAEHGHEHEHEEVDFDNIPLSQNQVDAVDLSGDPFVFCHPRDCNNIIDLCMAADLVLPDLLLRLKEPWPSWDALRLQRGGDRQTDCLVGSGLVRYQQVCLKRIESPMNTFYGCVI